MIQCFFRFLNVNVNVPWRHRERFRLFVPKRYSVTTRKFQGVPDSSPSLTVHRPWPFLTVSKTLRNGHGNGQERSGTVNSQGRWTVWKYHTVQAKRSETIAKSRSRSRFKNERIIVIISIFLNYMYKSKLKINNKVGALNLSSIRYRTVTYRFSLEFLSTLAVSRREPSRIFGLKFTVFLLKN